MDWYFLSKMFAIMALISTIFSAVMFSRIKAYFEHMCWEDYSELRGLLRFLNCLSVGFLILSLLFGYFYYY